jgi:checkpoint serine/threonine-protein kinase
MTSTKTTNSILNGLNAAPTSELVTVDIDAIEQQKENIQPLSSGRSALQLTTLSTQSRSGLGEKLTEEHTRFQNALEAVDIYETNAGVWEDGKFDLSSEAVATMSEDPLDIHHQYARFVLNSYPAGPSSSSRLLPLLESSTRKFLTDERYTNDPRYLRLWNLYAKNMEYPEDCYRFLFAKGIGERLAILYEEYALVLESAGK